MLGKGYLDGPEISSSLPSLEKVSACDGIVSTMLVHRNKILFFELSWHTFCLK